ncbi:MAG: hypothetical protein OEM59_19720 [Rhodospirillales bacterium]|nr:hypothetical protein [Rhodospirillales bacterium]
MTSSLDLDQVVALLKKLGGEQDEEVLAAARELHERITAAGLTWDDLVWLDDEDDDSDDVEDDAPEEAPTETPGDVAQRNAESLTLIDKLLAREGISDDFRQELLDYKVDIAEGAFEAADHRYLQAVNKRLSKQS